jgi:plasmid stability protein
MIAIEGFQMAQILIRKLEPQVKTRLQARARRNRRSMEEEAREILRVAVNEQETPQFGLGSEIVALFSGQGIYLDEPIEELRGMKLEVPDFGSDSEA